MPQIVDFEILSDNFGKLVFLQDDRTVSFHAPYGHHYDIRVPKHCRTMAYHAPSCDLFMAGSSNEIYRLNLDEGMFRAPLNCQSEGINALAISPVHMLMAAGGEDGVVSLYDTRTRNQISTLDLRGVLDNVVR